MDVNGAYCGKDVVRDMTLAKIILQHIPSAAAVVCLNGAMVAVVAAQCTTADALEVVLERHPHIYVSEVYSLILYVFPLQKSI